MDSLSKSAKMLSSLPPGARAPVPRRHATWLAALLLLVSMFLFNTFAAAAVNDPPDASGKQKPLQTVQITDPKRLLGSEPIAVLYPDIPMPYREIFTDILKGVEEQTRLKVRGYPVSSTADIGDMSATLKRNGTKVVIALGRQGLRVAGGLDWPVGVVVSGLSTVPDGDKQIGISLTPDPALLFAQLKTLVPSIRRVIVVYNPANNDWLIKLAREAARAQGLELLALEARDLVQAARHYEAAFAASDSKHDALWLPIDATTVDESTILPIVLTESWNRSMPIFSTNKLHVKKGALFSLSPNNVELGRNLANLAVSIIAGDNPRKGITPLRGVHTALNWRTAGHIGLNVLPRVQRGFDFLYPEP
jgi:putative ABC transport system substrate-binding protein